MRIRSEESCRSWQLTIDALAKCEDDVKSGSLAADCKQLAECKRAEAVAQGKTIAATLMYNTMFYHKREETTSDTRRIVYFTSNYRGSIYVPHILSPERAMDSMSLVDDEDKPICTPDELYEAWRDLESDDKKTVQITDAMSGWENFHTWGVSFAFDIANLEPDITHLLLIDPNTAIECNGPPGKSRHRFTSDVRQSLREMLTNEDGGKYALEDIRMDGIDHAYHGLSEGFAENGVRVLFPPFPPAIQHLVTGNYPEDYRSHIYAVPTTCGASTRPRRSTKIS